MNKNRENLAHSKEVPLTCDEFVLPSSSVKLDFSQKAELEIHHSYIHSGGKIVCQKQFGSEAVSNAPLLTLIDGKSFVCSICQFRFSDKYSLETHCLNEHIYENPIVCDVCQKIVTVECILNGHNFSQNEDKPFSCHICQKRFSKKDNLNRHVQTHTSGKPFVCDVCNINFARRSTLERHQMYIHTSEKPFVCEICQKSFAAKGALGQHYNKAHTTQMRFQCNICHEKFSDKGRLKRHYLCVHRSENPFVCEVCHKIFPLRCRLYQHLRTHKCKTQCVICVEFGFHKKIR